MTDEICSLLVHGRENLSIAGAMVDQAAGRLGIDSSEAARLRCICEEVAAAVVENAFDLDEAVQLTVTLRRQPGGVSVVVSDQGAPTQLANAGAHPARLTDLVRLGFADELQFRRLGLKGNEAEVFKRLPYRDLRDAGDLAEQPKVPAVDPETELEIEYRPLTVADTVEVARLFYRVHGYTAYQSELIYEPERFAEFIEAGRHLGTVAIANGHIVGHVASTVERTDQIVGLVGMLAVDPSYRRFGIGGKLTVQHAVRLLEAGFIGQYSTCVTVHVASQKIALRFAGHEVALLLAYRLASVKFRGFDDDSDSDLRRSNVMFYNGIGKEESRTVHIPAEYREITQALYENAALPRVVDQSIPRAPSPENGDTGIELSLDHREATAVITVSEYGHDFLTAIQEQLTELCVNRFEVIRLILNTDDPGTSYYGSGLRELGFFYCGVFPEYHDGDSLVLQYLNNVEVDPAETLLASEFGEKLRDFVLADREIARSNEASRRRSRARMARIYEALP